MNAQSIILLFAVLGLAGWALHYYIKRSHGTGGCCGNCMGCGLHDACSLDQKQKQGG